ncbi:hypothetical protein ACFVUH_10040 [Kitasatospora sp. NPDC058032]|uniref:hypothetical protein n=1 Tax=Kitasatospora sp. NPDC058032 TaxID=3346307 RepID=UPI0036D76AF1
MSAPIAAGWGAYERHDGSWEVLDHATSTAYTVAAHLGQALWRSTPLLSLPFHRALDTVSAPAPPAPRSAFTDIELAGALVRYEADDPAVLEHLRTAFAVAAPGQRSTPDVVCRLGAGARLDLLHRSMNSLRDGVHYRLPHQSTWQPLTGELPALPPLAAPPYRGRFFALHAALLVLPSGRSLLVCGNQKAGKTTACLWARDGGLAAVATDESVLIDTFTGTAFGVPLPTAVRSGGHRASVPLAADATTHLGASLPAAVAILSTGHRPGGHALTTACTADEALGWLTDHIRDAGASPHATRRAARMLVGRVPVHKLAVSRWPALRGDLDMSLTHLLKTMEHS